MAQLILSKSLSKRIDRSPVLRRIRWGIEAATLGLFWQVCAWLPPDKASAFGRWLLGLIGPSLRKSRHMRRNLSFAFPELDEDQRKVLLREVWGNTGAVLAEYPHLATFCQGDYEARLEIVSHRDLRDYGPGRRQGVFVTAHAGNWELGAAPTVHFGVPLAVVYAPIKNPIIDRMLRRWRAGLGCDLIDRNDGLPQLIRTLNNGGSLGLDAEILLAGRDTEVGDRSGHGMCPMIKPVTVTHPTVSTMRRMVRHRTVADRGEQARDGWQRVCPC